MARNPRSFVPGFPAHVVHRGNNGDILFRGDADFHFYWRCLKEAVDRFSVDVNAYVFMSNHVHLLLTPLSIDGISRVMHRVSRRYTGYSNPRYGRCGMLWQERFFASVVTTDSYLQACHRYIDMNPVRAMLVPNPEQYGWSSHRYYVFGEPNPLVKPHRAIASLANGQPLSLAYKKLVDIPLDPLDLAAIREAALSGRPIGSAKPKRGRPPQA